MHNESRELQQQASHEAIGPITGQHRSASRIWRRLLMAHVSKLALAVVALGLSAATSNAQIVPAPPGMGNYCSITWPNGGWSFASETNGGDPCQWILNQSPNGTVQRKGLYANYDWNRVVYRCYPPNYGWVGIYEGWGNEPLTWAYDAAQGKPGCIFNVSPKAMPIFDAPFWIGMFANYTHATGFDFAKPPYDTLNVADFGQIGSSAATIVDNFGRDKSGQGYIDNHDGHDFLMPRYTPIYAVANGTVLKARSWLSPCSGSDSPYQNEVAIQHKVVGGSGYTETFVSYYAHLSEYVVKDGDPVIQGQVIGYSGNTGCSTWPHLHFGVIRLSNTANQLLASLHFFNPPLHSDGTNEAIDPYAFTPPKGFDPWAWKAYPAGALSVDLWKAGQAPSEGNW
jgi:murein DD-endopeptidase MepM/ murein hydrolase activator NlpD